MRCEGESSSGRLAHEPAPVPPGHVAAPDPPAVCWFYRTGGPDGCGRSRTPMGVRGPGWQLGASFPQGHVASPDPSPSEEQARVRWPGEVRAGPVGPAAPPFTTWLRITTRALPCCSRSGYPCYRVPTVAPGPTSGEVRTRRWGHYCDLVLHNLKPLTAGVLTGFDYPSGCLLPHYIATAY